MAFRKGRSVSDRNRRGRDRDVFDRRSELPRILLRRTSQGRASIASNFFNTTVVARVFASGSFTNGVLKSLIPVGGFIADAATRALFAAGFVSKDLLAGGFSVMELITGGVAGDHTVTGIATGDELVAVWEQDGTSGLFTDLTSEFSITGANTINNGGGTDTSGDKLMVVYLDLTA